MRRRSAYKAALEDPSTENLHAWRRRVKDHWYHHTLLARSCPEPRKTLGGAAARLDAETQRLQGRPRGPEHGEPPRLAPSGQGPLVPPHPARTLVPGADEDTRRLGGGPRSGDAAPTRPPSRTRARRTSTPGAVGSRTTGTTTPCSHARGRSRCRRSATGRRAYKRGRRAYKAALEDPSTENLHAWRRRVKDHWYHHTLLARSWPEPMKTFGDRATRLQAGTQGLQGRPRGPEHGEPPRLAPSGQGPLVPPHPARTLVAGADAEVPRQGDAPTSGDAGPTRPPSRTRARRTSTPGAVGSRTTGTTTPCSHARGRSRCRGSATGRRAYK